jgi:hypothetical protein
MLFQVQGKSVVPYTETLLVTPFKEIWERDPSPQKEAAIEDFVFIEFTTSLLKTNPYAGYDENVKEQKVIEDCITREGWQPDELILQAKQKVIEFQEDASPTYSYYLAAKRGAEEMKTFFNNFSMNEVNMKTGNPVYKPADITRALKDTNDVLQRLDSMKKKVEQELFEVTKRRGEKSISPFANPGSM